VNFRKFRRETAAAGIVLTLSFLPGCEVETKMSDVSNEQVAAWIGQADAPLFLDVRSVEEFETGHIEGAVNIPHDQVASRIDELVPQRDSAIVVYCERGGRAAAAAAILEAEQFTSVQHMDGDMAGWRAAGLPTE
jgi:phage shock protein E